MSEEAVMNGGVPAPVETIEPTATPDGQQVEAVKPAVQPPEPEDREPKGVAKRLKELTDRIRSAEQREERYLKLLEQRDSTPAPKVEDVKPKSLQDFNYDENAYRDHLYTEARKEAEKAARDAGTKWKAEQDAIQRRAKFDERVQQFAKSVPDYNEVVTDSTPISEGMADAIMDSDEAGALMYYLGNNPDEALKLYRLTPAKAGRELQRLEDRLVAERKKAAEKPVSQAPPPAPKIEATAPAIKFRSTDPEAEKLSGDEWAKLRNKELAARRK